MGIYTEYLDKKFDWLSLVEERKKQLARISRLRGGRPVLTFAAALTKPHADIDIGYADRAHFFDQLHNITGDALDVILETAGGSAEIVEDLVRAIRNKFSSVGMIVPGYAKSAGTIMVMAGDEILLEPNSALGPIDAQVFQGGKRYSAHAFLEGLKAIKQEAEETKGLNLAYIPILQNISPGEIQTCKNAQSFAARLVTDWLTKYKFKFWDKHSGNAIPVTAREKTKRAKEIADELCNHGKWLTHGRGITLEDFNRMRLKVTDYSENKDLYDAISRYYILLKMSFDITGIYKIYETPTSQLYRFEAASFHSPAQKTPDIVELELPCPNCTKPTRLQGNFRQGIPVKPGNIPFPKNNIYECPHCGHKIDVRELRAKVESEVKKEII